MNAKQKGGSWMEFSLTESTVTAEGLGIVESMGVNKRKTFLWCGLAAQVSWIGLGDRNRNHSSSFHVFLAYRKFPVSLHQCHSHYLNRMWSGLTGFQWSIQGCGQFVTESGVFNCFIDNFNKAQLSVVTGFISGESESRGGSEGSFSASFLRWMSSSL